MHLRLVTATPGIAVSSPAFAQSADSVQAALNFGFALYATGKFPEAVLAFEAAAQRDNTAAQEILGMMLLKGESLYPSVAADEARGLYWLRRAAANGSDIARYQVEYLDRSLASAR